MIYLEPSDIWEIFWESTAINISQLVFMVVK